MYATSCAAVDDETLVARAAAGEVGAFDELYRRHDVLARRVAQRITGDEDDARDVAAEAFTRVFGIVSSRGLRRHASFRSYLLTTVRHVGIDKVRQRGRMQSIDEMGQFDGASPAQGPADATVRSEDGRLLLEAFRQLPERSRSVLWLVDVERVPTRVAAKALGLTAGNVAQIAVRARARLRYGYVQAHLAGTVDTECRFTVEHLGSFLDRHLCQTSVTKVEGHLRECGSCRDRVEELRDLGVATRRALVPALLVRRVRGVFPRARRQPSGTVVARGDLATAIRADTLPLSAQVAAVVSQPAAVDVIQSLGESPVLQRLVACIAAGTIAAGASSMAFKSAPTGPEAPGGSVVAAATALGGVGASLLDPHGPGGPSQVGLGPASRAPSLAGAGAGFAGASGGSLAATATAPPAGVVPVPSGTVTPATTPAAAGVASPSGLPAPGATQGQAPAVPTATVPPVSVPPAASEGTDQLSALPAPVVPSPVIAALAGTLPPLSVPVSVPALSLPLSASPLPLPPLTVPLSLPASEPLSAAPLSAPALTVPVSIPLATPPLTVPSLSVPVSVPPASLPLPVAVSTPPVSVPADTAPLSVPAVSDAVSTLPVSLPVAGPPLPVPPLSAEPVSVSSISAPPLAPLPLGAPLSTVTAGVLH